MARDGFSVEVGGESTTATLYPAGQSAADGMVARTLVLGHGAGAPQTHPWMVAMAGAIAAEGFGVVTFDFVYMAARRRLPDRPAVLEATWRAVIDAVRSRLRPDRLFIGGKSMGGRIATQVAAQAEVEVDGLLLLGYPLHPPGKPNQLRAAHLPRVRAPMLFVQGSRDPFGGPEELAPFIHGLAPGTRLFAVEGGDHSLATPRSSGVTLAATMARVAREFAHFTASR